MFDGIKIQDVSVNVDALLTNGQLTFGALVDGQTGLILNPVRTAFDRGLTFRLVPRRTGQGCRVEVKGSLHKFYNNGLHNADQYTANDLLLTLDQLVRGYGFDLTNSVINNVEFGVNLQLPFPVSQVLENLICYKNQPFTVDSQSLTPYYVCQRQRYAVKLYDKGKQKGLDYPLLRFEIRVKKMRYFEGTGVQLHTLADLMNTANYEPLGALLIDTFNDILFDDPAINPKSLTPHQRNTYQQCRNPRFWHTPDNLNIQQAATHRQRMSRNKTRFRDLLDQYGTNWPGEVATLIRQTWTQLTTVDDDLLSRINQYKTAWYSEQTCHELTDLPNPTLSQINPLYSGVPCDTREQEDKPHLKTVRYDSIRHDPVRRDPVICPVTGVPFFDDDRRRRFVSAAMLRTNDELLMTLEGQHRQYAKGSKEDPYNRAAHNVRNNDSNPRNNLRRQIDRFNKKKGGQQSLFPEYDGFPLTDEQRALLDYWKGTPYEVRL